MIDQTFIFVCAVFIAAGFVKGVIGLGLPTISMGLLAIVMPPVQAAALLLLPSFITNVWQMIAGPGLLSVLRRFWLMMVGICLGTWAGLGLMTGASARYGPALLGIALVVYAITGLAAIRMPTPKKWEPVMSPIIGAVTGLITAATGVFVIPAVPYLQAVGLEKEELVQALGLSFTISTLALAVNVAAEGAFHFDMASETVIALALACFGMWGGQTLRRRMAPQIFRRWFFIGLLALGVYLAAKAFI
ncbi:MAG: sulfite exporter TauE/SafE family protein [Hyphomicrobiaceae bacterium]